MPDNTGKELARGAGRVASYVATPTRSARLRIQRTPAPWPPEFFYLDVKKNKKEMAKLSKLLGRAWLEVIQEAELARDEADGNLLSPDVTGPLDNVENMIAIRRFISNGTDPSMLAKKKRTVLLFHHSRENAPRPA